MIQRVFDMYKRVLRKCYNMLYALSYILVVKKKFLCLLRIANTGTLVLDCQPWYLFPPLLHC